MGKLGWAFPSGDLPTSEVLGGPEASGDLAAQKLFGGNSDELVIKPNSVTEVDQFANGESQIKETEYPSDFATLLGEELCKGSGSGDEEECLIRRIISEAHLDYIYTQRHKP
ncbi:hypothetical protein CRG98_013572 [Punica granatum]|uniref:Phytosulfokine n=1 Tax=Punica granatum TaxID=22663 RepID=A0A2I0KC27_PUNGR|nr:hypothetical protein CRG98_013572 [Punica granatum]